MKKSLWGAAALAAAACASLPGSEWQTLIEGDRGIENFNRVGDANWRVEGGAIVADRGKSGFLVSKSTYRDFEIRTEFYAEPNTNTGIFIRCSSATEINSKNCYEVNVWDVRPDPKYGTGAIVGVAAVPVPVMYRAGGRWNTYIVRAKGSRLTVELNGVQTADVENGAHSEGYFGLQYAEGLKNQPQQPLKWRKVQIRPL